ncbi:MAG: SDR family oxidoreductase [Acidobacteria bacterium]|nr:SDR family oxidoreductase [Acidobacteriota bacterium]
MTDRSGGVLVTGGTGALGQWVVKAYADAGETVHVTWQTEKELHRLETFLGEAFSSLRLHRADVASESEVEEVFEAVAEDGGLRASVHIVGGFAWASLADTDPATWESMLRMNATSCFLCCRAAAARMGETGGRLVNVAAVPALDRGAAMMSAYSASKAAVLNLTQSLAKELAPRRITVNAIVPTIIDTPANRKAMPDADTSTWLPPAEIAKVISFLTGPDARILTGAALTLSL